MHKHTEPTCMNELSEPPTPEADFRKETPSTFQSIFFPSGRAVKIRVPDYQRAYSWEQKQIDLFIRDLSRYQGIDSGYYFGHFIAEDINGTWEIVDGQQRLTTFVLFLMVCRVLDPSGSHASAHSMIEHFSTVSYDCAALAAIGLKLESFLATNGVFDERNTPSDEHIKEGLGLQGNFTRSQRRMVMALLHFYKAFQAKGKLEKEKIGSYIAAVMTAHCSHHLTRHKTVAVNIFEMHNTRGVPLTTLEIVKATLMKFVYDNGGVEKELKVKEIQAAFGKIYGMEEKLAARSFRGEMTMEQLLRLHLRVVDDGTKNKADDFHSPAANATSDTLVEYVNSQLRYINGDKNKAERPKHEGVEYALRLADQFKDSVRIVSEILPDWDDEEKLVGDVLILERDLSCQFFLVIFRKLANNQNNVTRHLTMSALQLWERLLFTRDFHGGYHNLKGGRDDFPALFASIGNNEESVVALINKYLENGFRPEDRTKDLQSKVAAYIREHESSILNGAFYWWKAKMIYVIYKYEISLNAEIRDVMKGTVSVEHILPQEWQWKWIEGSAHFDDAKKAVWLKSVGEFINGIGNLLLITPGENSAASNNHPADKKYERYKAGSYAEHNLSREQWRRAENWASLVNDRGKRIYKFMTSTLLASFEKSDN